MIQTHDQRKKFQEELLMTIFLYRGVDGTYELAVSYTISVLSFRKKLRHLRLSVYEIKI
jgi:hypothetical protein